MVSVGRHALVLRKHKGCDLTDQPTSRENQTNNQGVRKRTMGRKTSKKHAGVNADHNVESVSGGNADDNNGPRKDKKTSPVPQTSFLRKQIDPETAKYFAEIANAIEGTEIEPEERSVICGNALEETRGKEAELATDYIISHTLQTLLEGCSLDHLCSFLQSCAKNFSHIAADRSGSHVVETALKSLSFHLQDNENHSLIEKVLNKICKTALKLLAGNEQELLHLIRVLLGSRAGSDNAGNLLEGSIISNILRLVEETAYSHLMEVILEFAPETLYNELLTKVFRKSLFRMSSHHCANFVVQALASHAKSQDHMDLIWKELGTKFPDLFEIGRAGVVASILAATQRLHSHENECCQAIAVAVCTGVDFPKCIVPRILFLENFFCSRDKSNWSWPHGTKIHIVGSLILQSIFRLPNELIQVYVTSITSLEEHHVLEASKDPSGSRVIEAFLNSNASAKQKRKLIAKFARQPDQWKSRQASQQSALKEFYATFGPTETKSFQKESFLADRVSKSKPGKLKDIRKEIETTMVSAKTSNTPFLAHQASKKVKRSKNEKKRDRKDVETESQRKKIRV